MPTVLFTSSLRVFFSNLIVNIQYFHILTHYLLQKRKKVNPGISRELPISLTGKKSRKIGRDPGMTTLIFRLVRRNITPRMLKAVYLTILTRNFLSHTEVYDRKLFLESVKSIEYSYPYHYIYYLLFQVTLIIIKMFCNSNISCYNHPFLL